MNPNVSKDIDDIACQIRAEYVLLIESLGMGKENDLDWWGLEFVSRNTQVSQLFKNCCILIYIRGLDKDFPYSSVLVDNQALSIVLGKYFKDLNVQIVVVSKKIGLIDSTKRALSCTFHLTARYLFSKLCNKKVKRKLINTEMITIVDTFLMEGSFQKEDIFNRYYGDLKNYFTDEKLKSIYYLPNYFGIRNYWSLFRSLETTDNIIIKEHYLKITDYIKAFRFYKRVMKYRYDKPVFFHGYDIRPLLNDEINVNRFSYSAMISILDYLFVKRIKENGIKVKKVIDWFENQVIDHGFNKGFREFYPNVEVSGLQLFPHPDNYLCCYLTEQEHKTKVIPTTIYVMGEGFVKGAKQFCNSIEVKTISSIRHLGVFNQYKYQRKKIFTIVMALPILYQEAAEIIDLLTSALDNLNGPMKVMVKPHPTHNTSRLINVYQQQFRKGFPVGFEFVDGAFNTVVEQASVLISSSSSTCLESIAKGIPTIVVGNNRGLTFLFIPEDIPQTIWRLCYSVEELRTALLHFYNMDEEQINEYISTAEQIRKNYFEEYCQTKVRNAFGFTDSDGKNGEK